MIANVAARKLVVHTQRVPDQTDNGKQRFDANGLIRTLRNQGQPTRS